LMEYSFGKLTHVLYRDYIMPEQLGVIF